MCHLDRGGQSNGLLFLFVFLFVCEGVLSLSASSYLLSLGRTLTLIVSLFLLTSSFCFLFAFVSNPFFLSLYPSSFTLCHQPHLTLSLAHHTTRSSHNPVHHYHYYYNNTATKQQRQQQHPPTTTREQETRIQEKEPEATRGCQEKQGPPQRKQRLPFLYFLRRPHWRTRRQYHIDPPTRTTTRTRPHVKHLLCLAIHITTRVTLLGRRVLAESRYLRCRHTCNLIRRRDGQGNCS